MKLAADVLTAVVALLHLWFLVLEMFLWTKPQGLKAFRMTPEKAQASAALAANQGLYNGFLSAGLIYSLLLANAEVASHFRIFFLGCVIVAGIYGGATVSKKIIRIQSLPALIALILFLV